jgi:hypothetical protein
MARRDFKGRLPFCHHKCLIDRVSAAYQLREQDTPPTPASAPVATANY